MPALKCQLDDELTELREWLTEGLPEVVDEWVWEYLDKHYSPGLRDYYGGASDYADLLNEDDFKKVAGNA